MTHYSSSPSPLSFPQGHHSWGYSAEVEAEVGLSCERDVSSRNQCNDKQFATEADADSCSPKTSRITIWTSDSCSCAIAGPSKSVAPPRARASSRARATFKLVGSSSFLPSSMSRGSALIVSATKEAWRRFGSILKPW